MMKINKPQNKTIKIIVVVALVIAVLVASACVYVYAFNGNLFGWSNNASVDDTKSKINLDEPTDEQKQAGEDIKKETVEGESKPDSPATDDSTIDPDSTVVDISITAAARNGSVFQLRTFIPFVTSSGACTLTLTKDDTSVVKTSDIQAQPSSSTCRGFDVPMSELSTGQWQASVTFKSGNATGSISKAVVIE